MSADRDYARLRELGLDVLGTAEVAAALKKTTAAATMLMRRLERAGLVSRVERGRWLIARHANRYAFAETLTSPFPSYVSLLTAMYQHGMIDQVPSVVYVVSLGRTQRRRTTVGTYSMHHMAPELFGGFDVRDDGSKLATPEKALFDVVYLSARRSARFAHLPELELPRSFRRTRLRAWIGRIVDPRRRSMVETRLATLVAGAID